MGYTYKKILYPKAQNRPDVRETRKIWKENQKNLALEKLIFLDESSINLGMTRLYGRGMKSQRVVNYVPDVRFQRLSILSAVRLNATHIPMVFNGSLNRDFFVKYVEKFLALSLSKGNISNYG